MLDATGHVMTWNVGAQKTKGYSADEIVGKHFSIFYTPEDRKAGKPERVLETVRREGRFEEESWRVRKDGSRFWASVVVSALRNDTGQIVGFAKVTRDLTTRLEAEENRRHLVREQTAREVAEDGERRLHESEARFRGLSRRLEVILEGIEDGITVQDRSGRLVFANTAAARLCGAGSVEELLRTPTTDVVQTLDERGTPLRAEDFPGRRVLRGENPAPSSCRSARGRRGAAGGRSPGRTRSSERTAHPSSP
jgi:PAS domain S-box-containing protein